MLGASWIVLAVALSPPSLPLPLASFAAPALPRVLHDVREDGVVWSLGQNWKMRFDGDGATYFPKLGPRAPGNRPVAFRLAGAAPGTVTLDGDRVTIDRGDVIETYDLSPLGVEQSFVLARRAPAGDITIRLEVTTDLDVEDVADGLLFRAPGFADVHYGDAVIVDAAGDQVAAPSRRRDGGIEITVPAAFAEHATWPIVVDPVITTFNVDQDSEDARDPDVAWCADAGVFLVVFEKTFSGDDVDLIARRFDAAGALLEEGAIETSNDKTTEPACAGRELEFLVVWENSTLLNDSIKARRRAANGTSLGVIFTVTNALEPFPADPDVGAAQKPGVQFPYLVTYAAGAVAQVHMKTCSSSAVGNAHSTSGAFDIALSAAVSQTCPSGGTYMVVWAERLPISLANFRVQGIVLNENGAPQGVSIPISTTSTGLGSPDVAGDGTDFLVVWHEDAANAGKNIFGRRYQVAGSLTALTPELNLSGLEPGVVAALDQVGPAVAYDGCRFTYVYHETAPGLDNFDLRAATLFVSTTTSFVEGHVAVATQAVPELDGRIAFSDHVGGPGPHAILWTELNAAAAEIEAALYSNLGPGGYQTVQTGCGGAAEPKIVTKTKHPIVGGSFDLLADVAPTATGALLAIGLPAVLPLCPTQGGCALGVTPTVLVAVPGDVVIPAAIPCLGLLVGATIGLQTIELLAPTAGPDSGLCGPPFVDPKLRTSDTLLITFR